jgi:hypothetical protein
MTLATLRRELVRDYTAVARFHHAVGNRDTARQIEDARDLWVLDAADLAARAAVEGDLLARCAYWAPWKGRA